MIGLFKLAGGKKKRRPLISEPINIVTGALGAGKTLFAIEQADLLRKSGEATQVYQVGINEPDVRKLPALPVPIEEWHIAADDGRLKGAVIIVDEFHKWMPQRGLNSRPPKFVEEMAECRRRGVRFILLTQSSEFDHFLKGTRLNRHFYLSRKSGLGRATIYEWMNRFVGNPEENEPARKAAILHSWRHPWKEYGDWYKSAESHHFRVRIPLRVWLVPLFIAGAVWFAYNAWGSMGSLMSPESMIGKAASSGLESDNPDATRKPQLEVFTDPAKYLEQFAPVIPSLPWSAPAYQGQEVTAKPDLFCMASGEGLDANGEFREASCNCQTEQGTPYAIDPRMCRLIAKSGIYNPFRPASSSSGGRAPGEADGKADSLPRPPPGAPVSVSIAEGAPASASLTPQEG